MTSALSRESLTAEGVDISGPRIVAGATNQFAVVLVDARIGRAHGAVGSASRPDDESRRRCRATQSTSGRMLIVDCHETEAADRGRPLRARGGHSDDRRCRASAAGHRRAAAHIDAIIAAEAFPSELTGYSDTGRALEVLQAEFGAPLVCVTLGADGSLARCGGREIRTAGFP